MGAKAKGVGDAALFISVTNVLQAQRGLLLSNICEYQYQCQSIESPNTKVIKKKQEANTLVGQGKGVGRCCFVELASQPCCKLKYKSLSTTTSY